LQVDTKGNPTATYGVSVLPATAAVGTAKTKVHGKIPFLGHIFNGNRSACKLFTGN